MIAIIDYDAGNLKSVEKALVYIGEEVVISRDRAVILNADKVILPGVGSFGMAMEKLREFKLDQVIYEIVDRKIPLLGICLGLQLLFESSEESKGVQGLGVLKGHIMRIPDGPELKVPHMGWNSLSFQKESMLFCNMPQEAYVYFIHSFYLKAQDINIVAATTEYGVTIHAAVEDQMVFACQFHPEKSGTIGLQILKNFADIEGKG